MSPSSPSCWSPRSRSRPRGCAFYACMAALGDALAARAPPEKPIAIEWPDAVEVDRGLVGGGRLAWPDGAGETAVPDWLVFGAMIRTASLRRGRSRALPAGDRARRGGFRRRRRRADCRGLRPASDGSDRSLAGKRVRGGRQGLPVKAGARERRFIGRSARTAISISTSPAIGSSAGNWPRPCRRRHGWTGGPEGRCSPGRGRDRRAERANDRFLAFLRPSSDRSRRRRRTAGHRRIPQGLSGPAGAVPAADACAAERSLHAAVLADPRRPVGAREIAAHRRCGRARELAADGRIPRSSFAPQDAGGGLSGIWSAGCGQVRRRCFSISSFT